MGHSGPRLRFFCPAWAGYHWLGLIFHLLRFYRFRPVGDLRSLYRSPITYALVSTVGLFAIITAFALFTGIDLTRWWMYIIFAILGMIVATVVNTIFFQSEALDFGLSLLGVGLFSLSTAATVQKVVKMEHELEPHLHNRAALIDAMMLYVNFINLFLRLLEIYSRFKRKE